MLGGAQVLVSAWGNPILGGLTIVVLAALVLVPLALGSLVGGAIRLVRRKRWDSKWSAGVALVLGPLLGVVAAMIVGAGLVALRVAKH